MVIHKEQSVTEGRVELKLKVQQETWRYNIVCMRVCVYVCGEVSFSNSSYLSLSPEGRSKTLVLLWFEYQLSDTEGG